MLQTTNLSCFWRNERAGKAVIWQCKCAEAYVKVTEKLGVPYVFKAYLTKQIVHLFILTRGPGMEEGVKIFKN